MNELRKKAVLAACAAGMLYATAGQAHDVWVLMPKYHLKAGDFSHVYVGYGFVFPVDEFIFDDWLEDIELVSPDGAKTPLRRVNKGYATPEMQEPGGYLVRTRLSNWYYTTSREGTRYTNKKGMSGVIRCTYHSRDAKAVFNVGDYTGPFMQKAGLPLEIVPLANPAGLKVGDFLDVQVLKNGQPYTRWDASVTATYSGFSFEGADAFRVSLDQEGKASIRITHTGTWMIKAGAVEPYPDPEVCDDRRYDTALTFGVR